MTSSVPEFLDRRPWVAAAIGRVVPPRIGTTLGIGTGVLASLAPGLLPRTPSAQAVLTGLLAALTLGVAGVLRVILRRCAFDIDQRQRDLAAAGDLDGFALADTDFHRTYVLA
ncbi:alpha/beta-hydrolase N-terminal domain-containing protein, partial [Nocardia abscessus]|uniref:alpha/beta-hydrolase N-terminal domain-containing protein n=1 Tax=Nocardia abscessus TaxID=120957 RepID=UPI002457434B